eukprot:6205497-Pleurochrysis_carterae.AAC.1
MVRVPGNLLPSSNVDLVGAASTVFNFTNLKIDTPPRFAELRQTEGVGDSILTPPALPSALRDADDAE